MAVKKDKKNAPLQEIKLDDAVQAYMGQGEQAALTTQIEKEKDLTEYQRRKRKRDAARVKATYDLTSWVKESLEKIAAEYEIPKSNLANVLLAEALARYAAGEIDLESYKQPSRNPRFEWVLEIAESPPFEEI
jgi:hypothetical protein